MDQLVQVEGRELKISNLEKILYPEAHFTKAEVVDYYVRVSPYMLPHLAGRPLTMVRFPDGVESKSFYMKECPSYRPDWMKTGPGDLGDTRHCLIDDLPSLIWVVNLASLEIHTPMAKSADIDTPTMVVFDLDPGLPADIVDCCRVGLQIRELLETLGLAAFPKTSGSKGLQMYVPLNTPATHDQTKAFAKAVAQLLERRDPKRITSVMRKDLRGGKVFVDWDQNTRHKTTISPYSMRARPRPWVSTPLRWEEVERCADSGDPSLLTFETADVLQRVEEHGDLFAPTAELQQELPKLAGAS